MAKNAYIVLALVIIAAILLAYFNRNHSTSPGAGGDWNAPSSEHTRSNRSTRDNSQHSHSTAARSTPSRARRTQIGAAEPAAASEDGIRVWFSPRGGCEAQVIETIDQAKQSIDVQAYSFTSSGIADALADALTRGVKVRVIMDKNASGDKGSQADFLAAHGISEYIDAVHPIAHNKVMIIDDQTIITGSFNFTNQAENYNAENLVVLSNKPALAKAYDQNFEHHLSHSQVFVQGGAN